MERLWRRTMTKMKMIYENEECLKGMQCTKCKSYGPFDIDIIGSAEVSDAGPNRIYDIDWKDEASCICMDCGHAATVIDFKEEEEEG